MVDITETRLGNLLELAACYPTDKDFCEAVGIPRSYLPQLKSGLKRVGGRIARRVEEALELERGWMDVPHDEPAQENGDMAGNIAAAHALGEMPIPVRDLMVRLIHQVVASCPKEQERDIGPTRIEDTVDPAEDCAAGELRNHSLL